MNVCIFGTGAVGGHIAARLVNAGVESISLVGRGPVVQAIRERGLTLRSGGAELQARPAVVTDAPATLPPQDIVLVALKAHTVPAAAAAISGLLAPDGFAVFLLNGVPWWWSHGVGGDGASLPLLDPEGALWNKVRPGRAVGCVVHSSNEMVSPGVIVHTGANHFFFGEPKGGASARVERVTALFKRGGMDVRPCPDIRREVLKKLVINASGNPIATLTRADLGRIAAEDELRALAVTAMREVLAVASAMGWDLAAEVDPEVVVRAGKPGLRPSMLQDALRGRSMEVEAVLGQIHAFAHERGVPVPVIDAMLPLMRALDRSIQLG